MLTVKQREQIEYISREVDSQWAESIVRSLFGEGDLFEILSENTVPYWTSFEEYQEGLEEYRIVMKGPGYLPEKVAKKLLKLLVPFPRLVYRLLQDSEDSLGVYLNYGILEDIIELGPTDDYLRKELEYVIYDAIKEGEDMNITVEVIT